MSGSAKGEKMIVITVENVCHDNKIDVRVVSFSKIKTFLRTVDVFSYVAKKIQTYKQKMNGY